MSKTIKNSFNVKLTFDRMMEAHKRASFHHANKLEILRFNMDLESNIWNIIYDLKNNKYKLFKYKIFIIYEPKERTIKALPYRDRIIQQWYIYEFIKPYIIPRLINSTCACIDKKGTHYAVGLVQRYMNEVNNNFYVLKLDIKKYFYSIDKDILFNIMCEYISDKKLINLTKLFIYDNNLDGLPIGNYTSQYYANIYLDKLDKYIKYNLKIKYYVRYMDDMIILLNNKSECKNIMDKIRIFLRDKLHLSLNDKSRYYPGYLGIDFCGYRIYKHYILIRNRSKKEIKKRIKKWKKMSDKGILDEKRMELIITSWLGHIKHANSYKLANKCLKYIDMIR